MANIRIRQMASDTFSWADDIAALLTPKPAILASSAVNDVAAFAAPT
jgi:hypothetical protein